MVELLLLDPNTGNPITTSSMKIPKNEKAEDYLNILMLFVDYKNDAGKEDKARIKKERKAIVEKLFLTYPFNARRGRVNVFTTKDQPDLGVVYSSDPYDMGGFAFKKDIKDQVEKYSYRSFISNGDVWKWKSPYGTNRSESCIGIISGNLDRNRGAFFPMGNPMPWAENEGATSQLIGHFLVAQPKWKSIKGDRVSLLSNKFMHELGHSLSLADEYEFPIDTKNNGIWTKYSFLLTETPNVVSRNDLLKSIPSVSAAAKKEGVFPAEGAIDPAKIPWEIMLGDLGGVSPKQKSKLLNLKKHNSRNITEAECKGLDENGDALIEGGPFKYNKTHGWCEKSTDEKLYLAKTTKDASTDLDIGLYEGGDTKSFDIFRPQRSCRMRYSELTKEGETNESYCWVCQKWILYKIKGPSERRTVINFKKWLKQDTELLLAMELAIRNP